MAKRSGKSKNLKEKLAKRKPAGAARKQPALKGRRGGGKSGDPVATPRRRRQDGAQVRRAGRADAAPTADSLPRFPIIGVGASAGGLEAFTQLLNALPAEFGGAMVLVQHLSPERASMLAELLASATSVPVLEAAEGMRLQRNHIYVTPSNVQMGIHEGRIHLSPRPHDRSQHTPIDFFFRSLAEYAQSHAIGIILSGTASDGSAGLREIKACGGTSLVQEPKSALHDGMPRAAIATGAVDMVLSPEAIARELARLARQAQLEPSAGTAGEELIAIEGDFLHHIFALLRNASGVDFTHYKLPTVRRRLHRRMVLHKLATVEQYLKFLQQTPEEVMRLYQDILIHVTHFFREPESFKLLTEVVFPQIVTHRQANEAIRIWVPGCATGEEAYSVAIAMLEFLGDGAGATPVQIFATDVSDIAVDQARRGVFVESIANDVSEQQLRRFFTRTDGAYRINMSVRDLCVFARQDLTRDPPFSKLDLVMCRNVLIYLDTVLQKQLMSVFHYALKPNGYLLLGSAETIETQADLFKPADKRHRLYVKKLSSHRADVAFAPTQALEGRGGRRGPSIANRPVMTLQGEANRLVIDRFAPPGVMVNSDNQVVQFRGQTGTFLEPAPGEASLNLLKMVREGLLYGLRTALHEARQTGNVARREHLRVSSNPELQDVTIEVIPLEDQSEGRHYLVLFESETNVPPAPVEKTAAKSRKTLKSESKSDAGKRVRRLQQELAASREYLQSIIQDLEAANEELQSANEEILSSNEELQSTNEELDTAKEELQSTNEELNTLNEELHGRNEELARVNSDLVNLLGSVQIAIVMIAGDLRIRRFTPMAEKVLNLIPSDIGRPISDIKPNIDCPDLEKLIQQAVDEVQIIERDVQDRQGRSYSLRIRPYKDLENKIDGAVLALIDVSDVRRQEIMLRGAKEYAEAIIETVREPLIVLDGDMRIKTVNRSFLETFKVSEEQTTGKLIHELGNGQWNIPALRNMLKEIVTEDRKFDNYKVEHSFPDIGHKKLSLHGRRINNTGWVLLGIDDQTDGTKVK